MLGLGLGVDRGGFVPSLPLLDVYGGAAAAYSLRKLRTDYTGAAIRVRESATNTEADIGFSGGVLDTTALLAHCGANDGFVTTWYDQAGSNNATQASAAAQPQIVASGSVILENGNPTIDFDGTNDFLGFASGLFVSEHSIFATIKQDNQDGAIIAISGSGGYYFRYTSTNPSSLLWYIPDTTNSTLSFLNATSNQELITAIKGFANVYGYINGGNETTRPSTGNLNSTPSAIGRYANTNYFGGDMQELILYPTDQSANRTAIESNINAHYNIYP